MTLNRNIISSAFAFVTALAVSFFLFWGTAFAATPTASLTATPSTITSGGSSLLSWSSTNATSCRGNNFSTGGKKSGSVTVKPTVNTAYVVSCSGGGGTATALKTVTVAASSSSGSGSFGGVCIGFFCSPGPSLTPAPICTPSLSSNKTTMVSGTNTNLSWSSNMSDASMHISWQAGTIPPATIGHYYSPYFDSFIPPQNSTQVSPSSGGSMPISPTETTTYIATCTAFGGSLNSTTVRNSNSVTITVLDPVGGSCSGSPASITTGQSSTWTANPSGGDGMYTYSWSGIDGLSGSAQSVSKTYATAGTKTASVSIFSAGSSKSISCLNSVTVTNPAPECSDGIDNDGDGKIDLADFGCSTVGDAAESPNPQCSNGIDDDGDGRIDLSDFGCVAGSDSAESPNPQCSDGIDNNGNGKIDYPADPSCSSGGDVAEEILPDATLSLTSDFELAPSLFSVHLSWSAAQVKGGSCSISGTNGDLWQLSGSSGTVTTSPLFEETIFGLQCTDLNGDPVSTATTVRIVPSFEEI